jgi:hypothetical protein
MTPDDRHEAQAREGLRAWAAFPAGREPRPVVLLGEAVRSGAFPDGQKKLAFHHGAIEAVPGFPAPVLQALRGEPKDWAGPPLLVTAATLGSARFDTDRGPRHLPAWNVRAQDVTEPILVLDPAVSWMIWEPPGQEHGRWPHTTAALEADGRTLTVRFIGSSGAYVDHTATRTLESGNAVALVYRERDKRGGSGWRAGVGVIQEVTALLARPLGSRVLLDMTGSPVMVTAADQGFRSVAARPEPSM